MIVLFIVITVAVFLGVMFARSTDPQTFQRAVLKTRKGIGDTIVYATFALFILYLITEASGIK
jgi:hypothetical protein